MFRRVPMLLCAAGVLATSACGAVATDGSAETTVPAGPAATIAGVGVLPDTVPPNRQAIVMVPTPVNDDGTAAQLLGEVAGGNRVLLIGDSIMASTSSRYGGQMCEALTPLGWQAGVEAEPSRFIDFGNRVLDRVLDEDAEPEDDWNAAVVFLGSNYGGDEVRYEEELRRILDRLSPRPTLLFTVTEYRSSWSEVNDVVRRLGSEYDNVTIIDWEAISGTPGVLSSDRLHPTETGREVLAESVAVALGPVAGEGDCLRSQFRDDSAINRGGGGGSTVSRSTGSSSRGTRTTTTTVKPSSGGTSGGGSTTGGSNGSTGVTTSTVAGGSGSQAPATTAAVAPPTTVATTPAPTPAPTTPPTPAPTTPPPAPTTPPPPDSPPPDAGGGGGDPSG